MDVTNAAVMYTYSPMKALKKVGDMTEILSAVLIVVQRVSGLWLMETIAWLHGVRSNGQEPRHINVPKQRLLAEIRLSQIHGKAERDVSVMGRV